MGTVPKLILSEAARTRAARREAFLAHQAGALRQNLLQKQATVQPDGLCDVTNAEQQMARMLPHTEVIRRLKRMNPSLQFAVSPNDKTKIGIYIVVDGQRRTLCGMENGPNPEFSIIHKKTESVPVPGNFCAWQDVEEFDRETRGWRTVLIRLLMERMITEAQIYQHFHIAEGRSSQKWQQAIQ